MSTFTCGVFTSWKKNKETNTVTIHFAVNRFVGSDLIHYNLPANNTNTDKINKKRVSLYIELPVLKGDMESNDIECMTFDDHRFNNLIYKSAEYTLELSYTTKGYDVNKRSKEGKLVECFYFPMLSDTIISVSSSGTHLWTEDSRNTKKIDIEQALDILSKDIVRIPEHIKARTTALVI